MATMNYALACGNVKAVLWDDMKEIQPVGWDAHSVGTGTSLPTYWAARLSDAIARGERSYCVRLQKSHVRAIRAPASETSCKSFGSLQGKLKFMNSFTLVIPEPARAGNSFNRFLAMSMIGRTFSRNAFMRWRQCSPG